MVGCEAKHCFVLRIYDNGDDDDGGIDGAAIRGAWHRSPEPWRMRVSCLPHACALTEASVPGLQVCTHAPTSNVRKYSIVAPTSSVSHARVCRAYGSNAVALQVCVHPQAV